MMSKLSLNVTRLSVGVTDDRDILKNCGIMWLMRWHLCRLLLSERNVFSARVPMHLCSTSISGRIHMLHRPQHPSAECVPVSAFHPNESRKPSAWSKHTPPALALVHFQLNNSTYSLRNLTNLDRRYPPPRRRSRIRHHNRS